MAVADVPDSRLAGIFPKRAFVALNVAQAVGCVVVAALLSTSAQWHPVDLICLLAVFVMAAEIGGVPSPGPMGGVSVSTLGLALAVTFLGPAPSVAIAVVPVGIDSLYRRIAIAGLFNNLATYATLSLGGSLVMGALLGGHPPDVGPTTLLFAVFALVFAVDAFSFLWVGALLAVADRMSLRRAIRRSYVPMAPFELVSAAQTGAAAVVYVSAGLGPLAALLAVLIASNRLIAIIGVAQIREQQVAELAVARARLLGEALTAEERERARLAGEIHDDALQEIALARIELRSPEGADRARRRLERADAALRATLSRIVPAAELRAGGLRPVLEAIVADLCEPAALECAVSVEPQLAAEDATLAAALARELVTNAVKHAGARRIEVDAARTAGGGIRLRVRDDGRGFVPAPAARHGHVGLTLVENRARAAGGRLTIDSGPDRGTRAEVVLPPVGGPPAA